MPKTTNDSDDQPVSEEPVPATENETIEFGDAPQAPSRYSVPAELMAQALENELASAAVEITRLRIENEFLQQVAQSLTKQLKDADHHHHHEE